MKHKTLKSILAFCLAVIVLVTGMVTFSKVTAPVGSSKSFTSIDENDRVKINQIADTTGAKVEHITKLRQQGKDWNTIVAMAKTGDYENEIDVTDYKALLDLEDKQEVEKIQLITNRVEFSLNEINSKKQLTQETEPVIADPLADESKDDIEEYYKLCELFENDKAAYLCVKLKDEFDTYENVIDEYLYCLQIEVDLADFLKDREAFDKQVKEKEVLKNKVDAITINKIEFKMLEVMKNSTEEDSQQEEEQNVNSEMIIPGRNIEKDPIQPPDVMPKKPQDEVKDEIEKIKEKGRVD